ncbi:MAG: threonine/serine dehydratase [Actinomycetota bacterium]
MATPTEALPSRADIVAAAERIGPHVRRTPMLAVGAEVVGAGPAELKLELLQHTGSFKPRGAFNRVLTADVPETGIIAASGGNHAAAVAHVGQALALPTEIFVPEAAPPIKLRRLESYPATVTRCGSLYDDAQAASDERAQATGALVVHPYDLADVIAGQGTVGREIEQDGAGADTVLVAVGGGGLIAGVAGWFRGDARVVAVEPATSRCLGAALDAGRPVAVDVSGLASDSLGARQVGDLAHAAAAAWVDRAVTVTDEAIAEAQHALWERLRLVVEPGGAAAVAALRSGSYVPSDGERVVAIVCGANTDPATVQHEVR